MLPELWREGDDVIYGVPGRATASLAHIIPPEAAVRHMPEHGLDVAEIETKPGGDDHGSRNVQTVVGGDVQCR